MDRKTHWENIYAHKQPAEVSWTEEIPRTSLDFIRSFNCKKDAAIIDVGGGDSKLVDHLLAEGYQNLSVLDISEKALERAKKRLGDQAKKVKWIVSDVNDFTPPTKYDVWHDRAAFHFLTTEGEIDRYVSKLRQAVSEYLVMGTFSENGPRKCSGVEIKQYSKEQLEGLLQETFEKVKCVNEDHITPFHTKQNFTFCSFRRN
jgi:cyclopropane fatty-acyl-phospholipid synthase-like methyltransferase